MQNQNDTVPTELREEYEEEEEEVEESVAKMAHKILDYRNTFSDHLKTTLASLLDSQFPILLPTLGRFSGSASEASLTEEDPEDIKKLELLKQKISSNAAAIPATLRRMRECMDHMDKLQSCKGVIHPAFKKRRTTD